MASDKRTNLTLILAAVIPPVLGIITGAIVSIPSSAMIFIGKSIYDSGHSGSIQIENRGGAPATNLNGLVESNSKILTVNKVGFSNLTLPKDNESILLTNSPKSVNESSFHYYVPKLVQGHGADLQLELKFDKPQGINDFRVFGISDQGSAKGVEITVLNRFDLPFTLFILFISAGYIGAIIWFEAWWFIRWYKKKPMRRLLKGIIEIRRSILGDSDTHERFDIFFHDNRRGMRLINGKHEFIVIDDAIGLIKKRELKFQDNEFESEYEIRGLNSEVLTTINRALDTVDWKRHT